MRVLILLVSSIVTVILASREKRHKKKEALESEHQPIQHLNSDLSGQPIASKEPPPKYQEKE